MKITPVFDKDNRRQTGNASWPMNAEGVLGKDIASSAIALKGIIQRGMAAESVEEANRLCDAIIANAESVDGLEQTANLGGAIHG